MPEWINDLIIAVGGGATATTIKLTNRLERSTKAYEILLTKEFEYYSILDPYMAKLVPLVQDLEYWIGQFSKDKADSREKYRELLLLYLEMIPQIKNDSVLYQPYVPVEVFSAVSTLLAGMQDKADLSYFEYTGDVMYEKTDGTIDIEKSKQISEKILKSIALVEVCIKNRLTELSSN